MREIEKYNLKKETIEMAKYEDRKNIFKGRDFTLIKILATNTPSNIEIRTEIVDCIIVNFTISKISLFDKKLVECPKPLIKSDKIDPITIKINNKVIEKPKLSITLFWYLNIIVSKLFATHLSILSY